jgi:hypothetical protein
MSKAVNGKDFLKKLKIEYIIEPVKGVEIKK